jgi:ABC transport system ATP-binding/permease protein
MEPDHRVGRAHFYAPFKYLGSWEISTFWFNAMAVWLMSLILAITLYYNTLFKILDRLGKRKYRKEKKQDGKAPG